MVDRSSVAKPPAHAEDDPTTIAVRAYIERVDKKAAKPHSQRFRPPPVEPSELTLIFDTETNIDAAQHLRFGTYQVRDGDDLDEEGIFYDAKTLPKRDRRVLHKYAEAHGITIRTLEDFIASVFFGTAHDLHATIVGFNLPFDVSRIACGHCVAKTRSMQDGFSFTLCDDQRRSRVQVKLLSGTAPSIRFAAPDYRPGRRRKNEVPHNQGYFVDVRALAAALTNRSFSLKSLAKFLRTKHRKLDSTVVMGPIDDAMIQYALRDTMVTWECFQELRKRYLKHGLSETPVHRIHSVASVGKAYLKQMGIRPWLQVQGDFPLI